MFNNVPTVPTNNTRNRDLRRGRSRFLELFLSAQPEVPLELLEDATNQFNIGNPIEGFRFFCHLSLTDKPYQNDLVENQLFKLEEAVLDYIDYVYQQEGQLAGNEAYERAHTNICKVEKRRQRNANRTLGRFNYTGEWPEG